MDSNSYLNLFLFFLISDIFNMGLFKTNTLVSKILMYLSILVYIYTKILDRLDFLSF